MRAENLLLLLVVLLPLAGALLGYVLRRSGETAAYLGLVSLLASAGLSIALIASIQQQPADAQHPITLTLGTITLPSAQQVQRGLVVPLYEVPEEQRSQYYYEVAQGLASNPAVQSVPIAFNAGRSQLLFTLTTALIAALCLIFGLWERRGDPRRSYFFATLTLFSSAMLLFLCADTLLLIYLAWELMGLCSFLLIGYAGTTQARRAAREAFWTTRATDFGLLLALIILMGKFGWTTLTGIDLAAMQQQIAQLAEASGGDFAAMMQVGVLPSITAAALLVLLAVVGKTALFPLSYWLPEAMVAPSPVSALLHAATMVAAGPFLLLQLEPLFTASPTAFIALTLVGGVTLVLGGLMALCARDAKRVLAYSTISQLSIPVLGAAVFASGPALYHLLAHAWFKAPLFLAVGYLAAVSSRHAGGNLHVTAHSGDADDHDDHTLLTRMAGSARRYPLVLATLILGGLALAGVAFTGGFFGKEQVLLALMNRAGQVYQGEVTFGDAYGKAAGVWRIGYYLMLLSLPLTAAYTARLVGILGWGKPQTDPASDTAPAAAPPALLAVVIAALIGCVGLAIAFPAFRNVFSVENQPWRWGEPHGAMLATDVLLMLAGVLLAWWFSVRRYGLADSRASTGILARLASFFASGMYLREFWTALVGRGGTVIAMLADKNEREVIARVVDQTGHDGRRLARASDWFDRHVVDGLRYWGAEFWWLVRLGHQRLMQNGSIQHYMLVIVISAVLLCFVVLRPLAKAFGEILGRM